MKEYKAYVQEVRAAVFCKGIALEKKKYLNTGDLHQKILDLRQNTMRPQHPVLLRCMTKPQQLHEQ